MAYIDAVLLPVRTDDKDIYRAHAKEAAELFKRYGMISATECWGDDVPEGQVTSMRSAVMLEPGETVVFNWMVWPSKALRDEAWSKIPDDPAMQALEMPFDGKRMIFGGFEVMLQV